MMTYDVTKADSGRARVVVRITTALTRSTTV